MDLGFIDMAVDVDDSIEMPDPVASMAFDEIQQSAISAVDLVEVKSDHPGQANSPLQKVRYDSGVRLIGVGVP